MKLIIIQFSRHWCHSQQYTHNIIGLRLLWGTGTGGYPWKHSGITLQEKLTPPVKLPKQSDSATLFIIIMEGRWNLNSFSPRARIFTTSLKDKVIMEEDSKTRFLFKRVKHSDLQKSIEALKAHMATNISGKVSYTTASKNLSTAFSEAPECVFRSRIVSTVSTGGEYHYGA